jgi:hypothetical protein
MNNTFAGFGNAPSTTSLDLPPALQQILGAPQPMQSYAVGGLVTPGGPVTQGMPPGGPPQGVGMAPPSQGPMDPKMMEMNINQFATQHPQELAQIRQVIMQELQNGNLTPEELNKVVQLAQVAAQNPQMYPQIRQFAIQQGLATEEDLPQQYDQGLVVVLLIAARAAQQSLGGSPAGAEGPPANAGGPIPSFSKGGPTPTNLGGKPIVAKLHENEYVVDKDTLMYHGKKTFDALVAKAREDKTGEKPA